MNEKILANITKEGKKLMATADSVFTEVTNDLISGTIVVGHLELILEHMDQFLYIWQLSKYGLKVNCFSEAQDTSQGGQQEGFHSSSDLAKESPTDTQ